MRLCDALEADRELHDATYWVALLRYIGCTGHDYLLAASCREAGATLITDNVSDFAAVRKHIRFEYEAPWPS